MITRHRTGRFILHVIGTDETRTFQSLDRAMNQAYRLVGNKRFTRPFPTEDRFLLGPGDGTTSHQVYPETEWVRDQR